MPEKKEQKIIVLLSLDSSDRILILNGVKIASIFRKELCLLYNYKKKEKKDFSNLKNELDEYAQSIKSEYPDLKVSTLLLSENVRFLPEKLSDDIEGIFIITLKSGFSKYSKAVIQSPVPFLFVDENRHHVPEFKNIILPLDFRKENSDSAMWSSYFGRFNGSEIVVVAANDKRKDEQKLVAKNVILTRKLYHEFKIMHKIYKGTDSSFRNAFESLDLAINSNADMLIILGSSTITPLDLLVGLPERKIVKKADGLPVLIINPRRDNYILCD